MDEIIFQDGRQLEIEPSWLCLVKPEGVYLVDLVLGWQSFHPMWTVKSIHSDDGALLSEEPMKKKKRGC
jgi:hypothetical protein